MPVEDHPVFIPPDDPNEPIWRYMDFTKFVSLLDRQALFFPSMETLAQIDPYEGSVPTANLHLRDAFIRDLAKQKPALLKLGYKDLQSRLYQCLRKVTFVSSWHINSHESAAMWTIYAGNAPGIALVSSYNQFKSSLMASEQTIFIGKVMYIDYTHDVIPEGNSFYASIHKRLSFAHERELRAVVNKSDLVVVRRDDGNSVFDLNKEVDVKGIYVDCDLHELVSEVVVSPLSPQWYYDLVESVCRRYNFTVGVRRTDLDAEPVF
jgi:hypothetical protein